MRYQPRIHRPILPHPRPLLEGVPSGWIPSTEYWYGPSRRWTWATDRARQEQTNPTQFPEKYGIRKISEQAKDDPTGSKQLASKAHEGIMYVTPEPYKDDVSAFLYYGTIGLMDPKNPADAAGYSKAFGWPYSVSLGVAIVGGFFFWGSLGWFFDPEDRRAEVGGWRSDWYDKWMNPDNYSLPQGW